MQYYIKQRVKVTLPSGDFLGYGEVQYQRMAPPTYSYAEAVSVKLDNRTEPNYTGTIFPAENVFPVEDIFPIT